MRFLHGNIKINSKFINSIAHRGSFSWHLLVNTTNFLGLLGPDCVTQVLFENFQIHLRYIWCFQIETVSFLPMFVPWKVYIMFATMLVTPKKKRRGSYKVYMKVTSVTSWLDLATSVCQTIKLKSFYGKLFYLLSFLHEIWYGLLSKALLQFSNLLFRSDHYSL